MRLSRVFGFALLAGCSGPDSATICHDYLVAAAELETKATPCSVRVQRIDDGAKFCTNVVGRCNEDGLKQWVRYKECLLALPQCSVANKNSWQAQLTACGAYTPTLCASDPGIPPS